MDKEIKGLEERLQRVNLIISKLDPAIKQITFDLFKSYILEGAFNNLDKSLGDTSGKKIIFPKPDARIGGDVRDFYASFDPKKPADSALVLAGWIYTQQGSLAFSLEDLRNLFDEVGVACPARLDMTLRSSKRNSKLLFQNADHGNYRPTVYGENYFKTEMNLRPGKKIN